MKSKSLLIALVCTILCAFSTTAAEPYAVFTASDHTLTFYYGTKPSGAFSLNTAYNLPEWYTYGIYAIVTQVVFDSSFAQARPISTAHWFYNMEKLTTITGLNYLNTSEVTIMVSMFEGCKKISNIDLYNFNTSKVTDMSSMFRGCNSLTLLDVSKFNTSKVTSMESMFLGCAIASLDLNSFDTSNVTNMAYMFLGCTKLNSLDLSSFNTSKVSDMSWMFYSCNNLKTILVDNRWSTNAVTLSDNMFAGCTSLVGGAGTTYDANHIDASYAHIDGGPSNPGYFTNKNSIENYDLWICGVQVTSANMNGVTGTGISGTVTYNPSTNTLTLNNATLDITNISVNAINTAYGAPANLKINLVGTNKILSRRPNIAINVYESQGFTIYGSGSLNCGGALYFDARQSLINDGTMSYIKDCSVYIDDILSDDYEECLTIDNADVTTDYLYMGSDHNGYEGLKLINCYVSQPEGGYVRNGCIYVGNDWWDDHVEIKRGSAPGILGDLDGSGIVDVEDVNAAINIALKLETVADYPGNGDMDGNGIIDVEDVNAMINIILKL